MAPSMRSILPLFCVLAALFAGCQSSGSGGGGSEGGAAGAAGEGGETVTTPVTRIVQREYRQGSTIFVMENEAGRDIKKLRSTPLKKGQPPISYVPDDVMERLLLEFDRAGFEKFAQARPRNPIKMGAIGEVTIIDEERNMRTILRIPLRGGGDRTHLKKTKAYVDCKQNFLAVYNFYKPFMQATTKGDFGVRRADFGR